MIFCSLHLLQEVLLMALGNAGYGDTIGDERSAAGTCYSPCSPYYFPNFPLFPDVSLLFSKAM